MIPDDPHADPDIIRDDARRRFVCGETDPEETRALVRAALLAGGDPRPWSPPATGEESYGGALDRLSAGAGELAAAIEADEAAAAELMAGLASRPTEELAAEADDPRLATWAAAEALRRESLAACTRDPARAVELARLAVHAAEAAREEAGSARAARRRADHAALAHGQLANALRVASDLRQSDRALERAFEIAAGGTGDPLVRARLLSLGASLRSDQSRYSEAHDMARRSAALYRRLGDDHRVGRTLLKQASVEAYREDLEDACATLLTALRHLDAGAEPRLAAVAHHNFASYLERLGRPGEAARELDAAEKLLDRVERRAAEGAGSAAAPSLDRNRLTWLRGRVAVRAGDADRGEELLGRARSAFVERGMGYEAAQVALELALVYAAAGRGADQRRLAEEMYPIFTSRDLHAEARAALRLYTDAARAEAAGERLIRQLASYLDRAYGRPGLRFDAG